MLEPSCRVELTASFQATLESIDAVQSEADAAEANDDLLQELLDSVIPNLQRFPRMGRRYLDQPPQSAEAITQLGMLTAGSADALRVLGNGNYLILYIEQKNSSIVYLLSIRHRRQMNFDLARLWPGPQRVQAANLR